MCVSQVPGLVLGTGNKTEKGKQEYKIAVLVEFEFQWEETEYKHINKHISNFSGDDNNGKGQQGKMGWLPSTAYS